MSPRTITAAARLALVAAVVTIAWLATTDRPPPVLENFSDKLQHAAAFLGLGLLADRSFPGTRFGVPKILALLAFGVAIEVVQHYLPYRDASLLDIVADVAGIALYAVARTRLLTIPLLRPPANG